MRIVTWNINLVRLRIDIVADLIEAMQPDVLCLQEIKCANDVFPLKKLRGFGYDYVGVHGQKGYHGVATLSRLPAKTINQEDFCAVGDCRHLASDITTDAGTVRIHNFYIPAGGDVPDPAENPKFAHKLGYLDEMKDWVTRGDHNRDVDHVIALGDFNIAPHPDDVWSHKQLLKVVSHTPVETERLLALQAAGSFVDLAREERLRPDELYTWWSYRAKDWTAANRGRRLDHIWASDPLATRCNEFTIMRDARGWHKPSDHVPVAATFDI